MSRNDLQKNLHIANLYYRVKENMCFEWEVVLKLVFLKQQEAFEIWHLSI